MSQYFQHDFSRRQVLVSDYVVSESVRCVQCGICSHNCPSGIDVRLHTWKGRSVKESECITCGECIRRCPRGALRFESSHIIRDLNSR